MGERAVIEQKHVEFIRELEALTRKYGLVVAGCGCCDSPRLDSDSNIADLRSGYCIESDGGNLKWVAPSDEYDWKYYSKDIVR
jgi:hypothetical protein